MTSESLFTQAPSDRVTFGPPKPKRRYKMKDKPAGPAQSHEPVIISARAELNRQRSRIAKSGQVRVQWRRVTPPSELMRSCSPVLAQVVDKVKSRPPQTSQQQSVWSFLRSWAWAFR